MLTPIFNLVFLAISFPGAEGFGANTPGGQGGKVYHVTNLHDSGPGSLRAGIDTKGKRIIRFRTAGLITLASPLNIKEPFLTIEGQSAPAPGITIRGDNVSIHTHDVVIRYIRFRMGDQRKREEDSLSIANGSRNVIIDHCSASWSIDEALSPSGDIQNVTVQWSIISESLNKSFHSKGPHGYGSLLRATGGVTLHHNLWAHHDGRNPRFGDNYFKPPFPTFDFRNNVIYDYGAHCSGMVDGDMKVNYVNNYIKPGLDSNSNPPINLTQFARDVTRFYLSGNIVEGHPEWTEDNSQFFDKPGVVTIVKQPFEVPPVKTTPAEQAYRDVLDGAGATLPKRDPIDQRIIKQVLTGTGHIINSQNEVGGWQH